MSNSNDNPAPPPPNPDDFAKTTPNIKLPDNAAGGDGGAGAGWDTSSPQYPSQPASDDWGNTVANIKPIDISGGEFGASAAPKASDWGETRPNINISDFGPDADKGPDDYSSDYGKTTPYFKLPEAERNKYQNLPPTPTEQVEKEKAEAAAAGGIPGWVLVSIGLGGVMLFLLMVLAGVAYLVLRPSGFELTVRQAPPGADIYIDKVLWGTTRSDGSQVVPNIKNGERLVSIQLQGYQCDDQKVKSTGKPVTIPALCRAVEIKKGENCDDIKMGEEDKAERCYYLALGELPDPFTVEELLKALNILIVNFDSNKYDVPPKRLAALQKGAEYIKRLPTETVLEIGGHTDNVGGDASNQTLSENRANAVKQILVGYGVRPEALQTRGYGASQPKTENNTEEGRFRNRRIQYSLVK